jgi:hypothetical protein
MSEFPTLNYPQKEKKEKHLKSCQEDDTNPIHLQGWWGKRQASSRSISSTVFYLYPRHHPLLH